MEEKKPTGRQIRLTSLSNCAGWASKLNAETLAQVLRPVKSIFDPLNFPDLLVGLGQPDDAAVWRVDKDRAIVATTDFFTPVVDDPFDYGQIAAANALSDVYAMGGTPFLALNVAAIPLDLPAEIAADILRGGAEKCREAGVVVAGGHTIQDKEPKFGLVVLGFVHPEKIMSKSGARVGDELFLTKPLGFGVTTTALKLQKASKEDVDEVVTWMKQLNRVGTFLASNFEISGGTDVTGFSLLGHGLEMADASGVGFLLEYKKIPFITCAMKYAQMGTFPGGAADNQLYFSNRVKFAPSVSDLDRMLLFDPQTSGGLLLAVPKEKRKTFERKAYELEQPIWHIGKVISGSGLEVV